MALVFNPDNSRNRNFFFGFLSITISILEMLSWELNKAQCFQDAYNSKKLMEDAYENQSDQGEKLPLNSQNRVSRSKLNKEITKQR